MEQDPFKEYLKESEPDKLHKGYAWSTAIGLQAVDGLKPSKYLIDTAIKNIEGEITIKEAQNLIERYYVQKPKSITDDERTEEADTVCEKVDIEARKVDIHAKKVDIEARRVDIQSEKVDIESFLSEKTKGFSEKTISYIQSLFEEFSYDGIFGRSMVMKLLGLKPSGASKFLANLIKAEIIEPVSGHGKGKYRFSKQ